MDFDLTDRVAIVTGGAQGLGEACCMELAKHGADIVVVAREPEDVTVGRSRPHAPVDIVAGRVQALGRRAIGITADVRDRSQVDAMVERTLAEFGRIDVLVNVVGGSWGETFKAGPLMDTDGARSAGGVPRQRGNDVPVQRRGGSSDEEPGQGSHRQHRLDSWAVYLSPDSPAYGAAKAGVINMTLSMAAAFGPEVRVNVIAVGGIETPHRPRWSESSAASVWPGQQFGDGAPRKT